MIYNMICKFNEGEVYFGWVICIIFIGVFVEVLFGKEGMIYIFQLMEGWVGKVEDEVGVGDEVIVKVWEIDSKGCLNFICLGIYFDEVVEVCCNVSWG